MSDFADVGPAKRGDRPNEVVEHSQGWGLAALILGSTGILASAVTHVICWLYVSLAGSNMADVDTRLGLGASILDVLLMSALAVFGIAAGVLGVRESQRLGTGRGLALAGLIAASMGLVFWLVAAANLIIVAIARLR